MQDARMKQLTLQVHSNGHWHDAMTLNFADPAKGLSGPCSFGYQTPYLADLLEHNGSFLAKAVAANHPLRWDGWRDKAAPAFLLDITPAGAAKRFLKQRVAHEKLAEMDLDLFLLGRCTPAPVGHMRIKESVQALSGTRTMGFTRHEVVVRDGGFLEYAYEQGAAIGGATGAGGEAPKLLMAQDCNGKLHPDATLADELVHQHWFVKFPRNKARETDQDILRSEYCFHLALNRLGLDTAGKPGIALEEAEKPSLWLPRFDRQVTPGGVNRLAVESIYSLCGVVVPGSYMSHVGVVDKLVGLWRRADQDSQIFDLLAEYLRRDLLNQILGNSDNHGRNISIIREASGVSLAPIYDIAPMVMDEEGVTRTTKWPSNVEVAGEVDWKAACQLLGVYVDPNRLFESLQADAQRFLALPDLLDELGLPRVTMHHPRIALPQLAQRLRKWGLV
jgi:serine/threonine-protein kinase HipA